MQLENIEKTKFYNLTELAHILGQGRETVRRKLKSGQIKSYKLGSEKHTTYSVKGEDVLKYLNK